MKQDLIRIGYNTIATTYLKERASLKTGKYLNQFSALLPAQSHVLDLGCGAGIPVDSILIKHGHLVTGIDISEKQIQLARQVCLGGNFMVGNMANLRPGQYAVDAVISLYAIFHLPRTTHANFLKTIASFLTKGGLLFITMGDKDFEGNHQLLGTNMWSSHFAPAKNTQLVTQAGFTILTNELDTSGGERHQIILARRN